jgi:hypothetical protein
MNKRVHISTIDRCLREFHFSLKKLVAVPIQRNTNDAIEALKIYARDFYSLWNENNGDDVLFLDEVGFQPSMRRKKGRAKRGEIAFIETRHLQTKNFIICFVINKDGIYKFGILDGCTIVLDLKIFIQFTKQARF